MEPAAPASTARPTAKDQLKALLTHCEKITNYKTEVVHSAVPHAREIAGELPDSVLPKGTRRKELPKARDPVGDYLRNYTRAFDITKPEKVDVHLQYFKSQVYAPNKISILLGPQNDEWLADGSVNWICAPEKGTKSRHVCVKLSIFYRDAVKYATEKERQLEAKKAGSEEWSKAHELNYGLGMMLCIYRICLHCTDVPTEVEALAKYIAELEKKLGLGENENPRVDDSSIRDFIKNATGGKNIDVGGMPDSSRGLIEGVTKIVGNNQHLTDVVQSVLGGVDFERGDPNAILGNVVGGLLDGRIHDKITAAAREFDPNTLPPVIRNLIPSSARVPGATPVPPPAPASTSVPPPADPPLPSPPLDPAAPPTPAKP